MACLDECNCEFIVQFFDDNDLPQEIRITKDPGNTAKYDLHVKSMGHITNTFEIDASGVIVGATSNLYNQAITDSKVFIHGFSVFGNTDGVYRIYVNGSRVGIDNTEATRNSTKFWLNRPLLVSLGDQVLITVENCGVITADYEGSLYLEVI